MARHYVLYVEYVFVLFAYVDEAYDQERYRLVAVVVDVTAINSVQQDLATILTEANTLIDDPATELHAHDLFHGRGFWKGLPPRRRVYIYDRALQVIADSPVRIVVVGLDRRRQPTNNWPIEAHRQLMLRLVGRLQVIAETDLTHVLIVADDHHAHAGMRDDVRSLQVAQDSRVVDTLHFVPSHVSPFVQAADLIGYLLRRIPQEVDPRAIAVNQRLLRRVSSLIDTEDISELDG